MTKKRASDALSTAYSTYEQADEDPSVQPVGNDGSSYPAHITLRLGNRTNLVVTSLVDDLVTVKVQRGHCDIDVQPDANKLPHQAGQLDCTATKSGWPQVRRYQPLVGLVLQIIGILISLLRSH